MYIIEYNCLFEERDNVLNFVIILHTPGKIVQDKLSCKYNFYEICLHNYLQYYYLLDYTSRYNLILELLQKTLKKNIYTVIYYLHTFLF